MVLITIVILCYTIVTGAYKPTYNWGAHIVGYLDELHFLSFEACGKNQIHIFFTTNFGSYTIHS